MAFCSHHRACVYISCSDDILCGFGSHLYASLLREGITVTNDKAYLPGSTLTKLARESAITKSNIVIVVISNEYPSSKHCLDELELIVKYDKKITILPVFYHVKSEDIRYQTGSFENAFTELGSKFPELRVNIWRNGFREVAAKAAYEVNIENDRDEAGIVEDITRDVSSMMKCECSLDAQGLNDAILLPTTTHRTSSMPVSGGLSKDKQIAEVEAGKIPVKLGPQVGSQSEEHLEKLAYGKLPSKKIYRPEICRGQVAEEESSSFSDVNHDVDQRTLAKDSVPSQDSLEGIRTASKTISDCFSRGSVEE